MQRKEIAELMIIRIILNFAASVGERSSIGREIFKDVDGLIL